MAIETKAEPKVRTFGENIESDLASRFLRVVETAAIAAALVREVEKVGSPCSVFLLEDYAIRPLSAMPEEILGDLALSQVSIFAAQAQIGESTEAPPTTNSPFA